MPTLVVGDLHLKQPFVLPRVDALLAERGDVEHIVFLGDACDDWGARPYQAREALDCYASWVERHRAEGMRVDVLLGNHDFCYIRGRRGPGTIASLMREVRSLLEDRLHVQAACVVGPHLCTHAGITGVWAAKHLQETLQHVELGGPNEKAATSKAEQAKDRTTDAAATLKTSAAGHMARNHAAYNQTPTGSEQLKAASSIGNANERDVVASKAKQAKAPFAGIHADLEISTSSNVFATAIAEHLNSMLAEPDCWSALDSCPPSRGGWQLPGPLWADLRDLQADPLPGVSQLVGHTPVATAEQVWLGTSAGAGTGAWACDTLSLTSTGMPIGDGSMLLVDDHGRVAPIAFPGDKEGFRALVDDHLA